MNKLAVLTLSIVAIASIGCSQSDEAATEKKMDTMKMDKSTSMPAAAPASEETVMDKAKSTVKKAGEYVGADTDKMMEESKETATTAVKEKAVELEDTAKDKAADYLKNKF